MGLPEMAEHRPRTCSAASRKTDLAWAVAAYVSAKRNQMDLAGTDLMAAVRHAPDDPFVQRTAGPIDRLGRYPNRQDTDPGNHADSDRYGPQAVQRQTRIPQAYQDATQTYRELAAAPSTAQPAQPAQSPDVATSYPGRPPPTTPWRPIRAIRSRLTRLPITRRLPLLVAGSELCRFLVVVAEQQFHRCERQLPHGHQRPLHNMATSTMAAPSMASQAIATSSMAVAPSMASQAMATSNMARAPSIMATSVAVGRPRPETHLSAGITVVVVLTGATGLHRHRLRAGALRSAAIR